MKARLKRISARAQKIVEEHFNGNMEDIYHNLAKAKKEVGAIREVVENTDSSLENIVDAVLPGLDFIEECLDCIINAK